MKNLPDVPEDKKHLSPRAASKEIHKITIIMSLDHYKDLQTKCKDLKLNSNQKYSQSKVIENAIEELYNTNPDDFKNGFTSLLWNLCGTKWNENEKQRVTFYLHQDNLQKLYECSEGFPNKINVSNSEIVAAALELYLFRSC